MHKTLHFYLNIQKKFSGGGQIHPKWGHPAPHLTQLLPPATQVTRPPALFR